MHPNDHQLRLCGGDEGACPSPLDLAAWCDGRLDERAIDGITLHLDSCARCREACLGLDESRPGTIIDSTQGQTIGVSDDAARLERIVARASSLVFMAAPAAIPYRAANRTIRRGLAAAAMLAASLSGWWVGVRLAGSTIGRSDDSATMTASTAPVIDPTTTRDTSTTAAVGEDELSSAMLVTFGLMDVDTTNEATSSPGLDES